MGPGLLANFVARLIVSTFIFKMFIILVQTAPIVQIPYGWVLGLWPVIQLFSLLCALDIMGIWRRV